jgi:BASS family bile acid:Na+ symporter
MTIDQLINVLVTVTLIEMMAAIGLGVKFADFVAVAKNWRLLGQAALANYVAVPAVTIGLLLLVHAQPMAAAGFLILAVCPGAPFGPPFTAVARGNVAVSVGLMAVLAASSVALAPLLLYLLLPLTSGGAAVEVDAVRLVGVLLLTQLAPLALGLAVRQWRPRLADRLVKPANLVGKVLNVLAVGVILVAKFPALIEVLTPTAIVGMSALLVASLAAGWALGGSGRDGRKAMTLTTALRNVGLGLAIASASFAGKPQGDLALTAVIAYGLFEVVGSLLLALAWGRRAPAKRGVPLEGKPLPESIAPPPPPTPGGKNSGS